ncbi:MAG: hypothetical protein PUH54_00745, partial [Oscillospiraceae bacterium]|nr:hypothetical protein [Oscillospiraceae bacterium]
IAQFYHYFHNPQNSGLVDRINKYLHLDITTDNTDKKEQFETLKLLKYIRFVENSLTIPLLNLLNKPRINHFDVFISEEEQNYDQYDIWTICNDIKEAIPEEKANHIEKAVLTIFVYWCKFKNIFYKIVRDYEAMESGDNVKIMQYVQECLKEISSRIEDSPSYEVHRKNSVLECFFTVLCSYCCKCYVADLQNKLFEGVSVESDIDDFMLQMNLVIGKHGLSYEQLDKYEKYISGKYKKPSKDEKILYIALSAMIKAGLPSDFELVAKDVRFAVKHYMTIIDWLFDGDEERKRQYCHDDIIAFHIIIPVLQEMIFVSNKNTSYVNDYLNAKHRTTFSSIIKKPEKADAIGKSIIINRIEYRYSVFIGSKEAQDFLVRSEEEVYKIMDFLLSYKNIEDMIFAHDYLSSCVEKHIISQLFFSPVSHQQFLEIINHNMNSVQLTEIQMESSASNILFLQPEYIEKAAVRIAEIAEDTIQNSDEDSLNRIIIPAKQKGMIVEYDIWIVITFIINNQKKTVLIINADEVYDDDYISRVEEINLGKFVSD